MSTAQYGSLPFSEAITFIRGKVDIPTERYTDVWRQQHNVAFVVAGATKADLLADIRLMVDNAIANGQSLSSFQRNFPSVVKKHGWDHSGNAAWRANIIYSTNMRQSYNAGRYQQLQTFPYWEYRHGDSLNPRLHHQSKNGLILPKDSPFWDVWFPQNGWGCKCKIIGRSEAYMKRKGLKPSKEPVIETQPWTDKATGEVHYVPVGIDPGFDYTPGKVNQADKLKDELLKRPPIAERLPSRTIPSAFSTVPDVNIHGLNRITDELLETSASPQIEQLVTFIHQRDIKTVIIKSREMSKGLASQTIAEEVGSYLGVLTSVASSWYTVPRKLKPEGFTSISFDHVNIKASTKHSLKYVNVTAMLEGIRTILKDGLAGKGKHKWNGYSRWFAASEATGSMEDNASRYITWLHELGHQVHYKAGTPSPPTHEFITEYGSITNEREWFAEHFVFWLLARNDLAEAWPETATWFDNIMQGLTE